MLLSIAWKILRPESMYWILAGIGLRSGSSVSASQQSLCTYRPRNQGYHRDQSHGRNGRFSRRQGQKCELQRRSSDFPFDVSAPPAQVEDFLFDPEQAIAASYVTQWQKFATSSNGKHLTLAVSHRLWARLLHCDSCAIAATTVRLRWQVGMTVDLPPRARPRWGIDCQLLSWGLSYNILCLCFVKHRILHLRGHNCCLSERGQSPLCVR